MNTNPNGLLALPFKSHRFRRCALVSTVAVRWIARTWGIASALLLLVFAFGGREHLRFTAGEAIAFLLFPVGVIAGFVIAWWRELMGGLVTVGCFVLFCLLLLAWSGRWPGIYFILFAAPGFLHIGSFILAQRGSVKSALVLASTCGVQDEAKSSQHFVRGTRPGPGR